MNRLSEAARIVIFGSSGFIGSRLVEQFRGWDIVTVDRNPKNRDGVTHRQWDGKTVGDWIESLEGADAVINLSGSPISVKWTSENRREIVSSRTVSTETIGKAIAQLARPPKVWVNGSATGFYGDRGDTVLYEDAEGGVGFLADVCRIWEQTAVHSVPAGVRLVLMRTGFVLGRQGGAFKVLRKLALYGLGGAAGSGSQWIPWIHLDDLCRMFQFAVENERLVGVVNGSAPEPVRNREFMTRLRKELSRPWSPPAPAMALRILGQVAGPSAELLLGSQRAVPRNAIDHGFSWTYGNLGGALDELNHPSKGPFLA